MKLATTTADFSDYPISQEEKMYYINKAGFKYLDYDFGADFRQKSGFFSSNRKEHLEKIKQQCDSLGVRFVQAHSPMGRPIVKNSQYDDFIEGTKICVEACARLKIPNIVVHSGYCEGLSREETFEKNLEFYLEILRFAEKHNVNILTENFNAMCVPGLYWIDNAADLRALIDYVDHPLFHACWDTGHANLQPMPQHDELKILGEHVYGIHVQDNLGNDDHHFAPFMGTTDFDSLMKGLFEIGYKGYFTFEATNIFASANKRRSIGSEKKLSQVPPDLRLEAEKLLYKIGMHILAVYNCR